MRWDIDDSAKRFHLAFEADPALLRQLEEALELSASAHREEQLERIRREAPEGWRPSPDDPGTFVPLDEDSVRSALVPLAAFEPALVAFFDRHRAAFERARWEATVRPPREELERFARELGALPFEALGLERPSLATSLVEVRRAPWEDLEQIERARQLVELSAPDEIVRPTLELLASAVGALELADVEAQLDRREARDRFAYDDDGTLDHDGLLEACLDVCAGPFARSVGIGPCLAELVP